MNKINNGDFNRIEKFSHIGSQQIYGYLHASFISYGRYFNKIFYWPIHEIDIHKLDIITKFQYGKKLNVNVLTHQSKKKIQQQN